MTGREGDAGEIGVALEAAYGLGAGRIECSALNHRGADGALGGSPQHATVADRERDGEDGRSAAVDGDILKVGAIGLEAVAAVAAEARDAGGTGDGFKNHRAGRVGRQRPPLHIGGVDGGRRREFADLDSSLLIEAVVANAALDSSVLACCKEEAVSRVDGEGEVDVGFGAADVDGVLAGAADVRTIVALGRRGRARRAVEVGDGERAGGGRSLFERGGAAGAGDGADGVGSVLVHVVRADWHVGTGVGVVALKNV